MSYEEKQITCADCGAVFPFSVEDQKYYASKGYSDPKRCPACRAAKKSQRTGFKRSNFQKKEYHVTCSACGCETTVPFEPKDDKPVYCRDCYKNMNH